LQAKVAVPEIAHRNESCQVPFKLDGRLTPVQTLLIYSIEYIL